MKNNTPKLATTHSRAPSRTRTRTVKPAPVESREDLIVRYLPIVKSAVSRIKINLPSHIEEEDLHSVGITGLFAALDRYDPAQKESFGGYAALRIRGAILDELRRMDWMPRNVRASFKRLRSTIEELEQTLGRPATEEETRTELKLSPEEYARLLDNVRPVTLVPLDQKSPGNYGEGVSLSDVVPDDSAVSAIEKLDKEEMIQLVGERINQLPEVARKVIAMSYYENMRLAEIAAVFGLTESRICQIHSQAVSSLRAYMKSIINR